MIAGTLEIQMMANFARLIEDVRQVQQKVDAGMSAIERSVGLASKALGGLAAGFSVTKLVGYADAWGQLTSRMDQATGSMQAGDEAMRRLMDVSNRVYKPIADTAELFIRTSESLKQMGYSTAETVDMVETLSYGLTVSSASAEKTKSVIDAWSKSMLQGKMTMAEYQTVISGAPALQKSLADALGVTISGLQEMVAKGQLSADKLMLVTKQMGELGKQADDMPVTVSDAFTKLVNNITQYAGELNKSTGATKHLTDAIGLLANNVGPVLTMLATMATIALASWLSTVAAGAMAAGGAFGLAAAAVKGFMAAMGPVGWLILLLGTGVAAYQAFSNKAREAGRAAQEAAAASEGAAQKMMSGLGPALDALSKKYAEIVAEQRKALGLEKSPLAKAEEIYKAENETLREHGRILNDINNRAGKFTGMTSSQLDKERADAMAKLSESTQKIIGLEKDRETARSQAVTLYVQDTSRMTEAQRQAAEIAKENARHEEALGLAMGDAAQVAQVNAAHQTALGEIRTKYSKQSVQGAKQEESAYKALMDSIKAKIAEERLERESGEALTESQRIRIKLAAEMKSHITPVHRALLEAQLKELEAEEKLTAEYKDSIAARKAWREEQQKSVDVIFETAKSLQEGNKKLREEIELIGLTSEQQALVLRRREEAILLVKEQHLAELQRAEDAVGFMSRERIALEQEVEARRELLGLLDDRSVREANAKAQQQIAQDWEKVSQTIGRTLSDYIMGGGKDAAQYLKRLFATLVLEPVVNYGVQGMMSGLGMGPGQQAGGGVLGAANSASSLWSAFSGGTSGTLASGVVGLGKLMGSSFMGELGAGIAAGGQLGISGTASLMSAAGGTTGAGMAIGAALPWIAGGLAVASLLGGLDFGSRGANHSGAAASSAGIGNDAAALQIFGRASGAWYGDVTKRHSSEMEAQLAGTVGALSDVYKQLAGYAGETARQIDVIGAFAVNGKYGDEDAYGYGQIRDSLTGEVLAAFTNRNLGTDANAAWEAYVGQMGGLIVDQLKAADIPGWMRGEFDKLGDTITVDGLNQALQAIAAVDASFKSWSNTLAGFADLSGDVQTALLQVSGGLEGLAGSVGAFYQSFYDEAERMEILQRQVREALAGLEVGLDPSLGNEAKEGFRWAVENALAAGNGELAAQLLAMGQSFATAADYAQKSADEAIKAAQESAERVSEIMGQQNELWAMLAEAQGDHARAAQLRYELETAGMNEAERAAYDYIASIRAQVSAAQAASASLKSLSDQQWQLENQLLTLQGNTGAVASRTREKELGELLDGVTDEDQRRRITASYDYNRSLQQQIEAMQAAQQAASAAASAQQQAADRIRSSWQQIGDSVVNEINRIRGLVVGDSGMGLDYYQAQFAIASAQARAGDEEAAKRLPEISQAMLKVAEASATSLTELQRYRNQTAGSLEETLMLLSKQFGLSVDLPKFDVGTNYVPQTMAAIVHQGEAIVPKAYNPWAGGMASGSRASNAKLEALVSQLVEENRVQAGEIARLNLRMARVLERWDIEGIPEEREG